MPAPDQPSRHRWEEIEPLLDRALDLPGDERDALLDAACAGDADLRGRIDALLLADERAGAFLDMPALERCAPLVAALYEDPLAGAQIGAYRLLRECGRGGMGVVYVAERSDGQFQHQVALKLIKRGMDSDAILQRFLHERQILARLQHPNVARLLDGGMTADGQPWFAMEYVDGSPLTTWCDERRLGIDERLALFLRACAAVQYAHQNLVVHRDLKPGNMLVTASGELKLVDFGIARLLGADSAEATLTEVGSRPMTPEYAPPEMLRGEQVTTAADVYALGVVLYELLAGYLPREMARADPEAMARLAETEPAHPSTAAVRTAREVGSGTAVRGITPEGISRDRGTRPDRLRRRLAGDLDTICLKAIKREPERRYPSVQALHDDIERHLSGLPVSARPDTLAYRASRFVRRHRIGVTAASTIAALLIGFSALTAVQSARIRAQADRIASERDKAEEVVEFVLSLFNASNPHEESRSDSVTARDLLERGVVRIDEELGGQPEVQAEMLAVIGRAYTQMGRFDRAGDLLEQALALRRKHLGTDHEDVAQSLDDLGTFRYKRGDYASAEPLLRESLAIRRRLLGNEHLDVASSLNSLGILLRQAGVLDEAESCYRESLALKRKLLGEEHREVLISMNNLAVLLIQKRDLDAAEAMHRETLALRRRVLGEEHIDVGVSLNNLGWTLSEKRDYAAAEPIYREALAMRRKSLGEEHPEVALCLNNLGGALTQMGRLDEAEPLVSQALAMRRRLVGENHNDVGASLRMLGEIRGRRGDLADAERLTLEALDIFRKTLPQGHIRIGSALASLGRIRLDQGRREEAASLLQKALEIHRARYGPADPVTLELEALLNGTIENP